MFRKTTTFFSLLKRNLQQNVNESSGEEERKDEENAIPITHSEDFCYDKKMGLYIQVVKNKVREGKVF